MSTEPQGPGDVNSEGEGEFTKSHSTDANPALLGKLGGIGSSVQPLVFMWRETWGSGCSWKPPRVCYRRWTPRPHPLLCIFLASVRLALQVKKT